MTQKMIKISTDAIWILDFRKTDTGKLREDSYTTVIVGMARELKELRADVKHYKDLVMYLKNNLNLRDGVVDV